MEEAKPSHYITPQTLVKMNADYCNMQGNKFSDPE
jgi:hypothetical protein